MCISPIELLLLVCDRDVSSLSDVPCPAGVHGLISISSPSSSSTALSSAAVAGLSVVEKKEAIKESG